MNHIKSSFSSIWTGISLNDCLTSTITPVRTDNIKGHYRFAVDLQGNCWVVYSHGALLNHTSLLKCTNGTWHQSTIAHKAGARIENIGFDTMGMPILLYRRSCEIYRKYKSLMSNQYGYYLMDPAKIKQHITCFDSSNALDLESLDCIYLNNGIITSKQLYCGRHLPYNFHIYVGFVGSILHIIFARIKRGNIEIYLKTIMTNGDWNTELLTRISPTDMNCSVAVCKSGSIAICYCSGNDHILNWILRDANGNCTTMHLGQYERAVYPIVNATSDDEYLIYAIANNNDFLVAANLKGQCYTDFIMKMPFMVSEQASYRNCIIDRSGYLWFISENASDNIDKIVRCNQDAMHVLTIKREMRNIIIYETISGDVLCSYLTPIVGGYECSIASIFVPS